MKKTAVPFLKPYKRWFGLLTLLLLGIGLQLLVQSLGGWQYLWFKIKHDGQSGVYVHRMEHFESLPQQKGAIIFAGNSLTAQCNWNELLGRSDILNRGIDGDFSDGLLKRLPEILRHQPSHLFLMIGINDLAYSSVETLLQNIDTIVVEVQKKSPETVIILQELLPVNNTVRNTGRSNDLVRQVNRKLESVAQNRVVLLLKGYRAFADTKGRLKQAFTSDGIHLNAAGYLCWKKELQAYLP